MNIIILIQESICLKYFVNKISERYSIKAVIIEQPKNQVNNKNIFLINE